jgi:DNA-binding transcriptional LysR family regulator
VAGTVELREIEIFLALAEELHFGRTAERLYLSQARVSQAIRALERFVGGRLFERTSRRVRLTPLAEVLVERLRPAYQEINQAFQSARDLAGGIVGELRLAVPSLAAGGPAIGRIIATFERRYPGSRVLVQETGSVDALADLRRGELDLMVVWLPVSQPDLTIGPGLTRQERALLVRQGHPLAARGHATVEDLADHPVSHMEGILLPETAEAWIGRRTPSGRAIETRPLGGGAVHTLAMVASGAIVHPTVASFSDHYRHPEVTQVPLQGLPPAESALAWISVRETAAICALAAVAREVGEASPAFSGCGGTVCGLA